VAPEPGEEGGAAQRPALDVGSALNERLYVETPRPDDGETLSPEAVGAAAAPFTQSRVFPPVAVRTFPYRAIGKVFARDPRGDFTCTAFVIERSVIATAGHCVFDFVNGRGALARDFLFVPAFDRGRAPFGRWTGVAAFPARSWQQGDGRVPHPADFAVITLQDQLVDGRRTSVGDVVGWLGWQLRVPPTQVTILGYPGNLDRGQRMQATHAGLFQTFPADNAVEFGSGQGGGSSGGPIVEDLGEPAAGQPRAGNRVISVVSFGTDGLWTLGGSILSQEFAGVMEQACRQRRRNCS
jgi:hypothetical protein